MSDLRGRLVQQGEAIVLDEANVNFRLMNKSLLNDKGVGIKIMQSYMSKYDIADELRKIVKDKTTTPPLNIRPLLDPKKPISDIVNDGLYPNLESYLEALPATGYEPPLKPNYTSVSGIDTICFPNKISIDPRRSGLLLKIGPTDVLKTVEIRRWMVNNSILYGFVLYDTNALYYLGIEPIKQKLRAVTQPDQELRRIVGLFLRPSGAPGNALSLLTETAQQVITNIPPAITTFTDPGNLESIPNSTARDNNGMTPDLIVIDDKPVVKEVGLAYLAMREEAARSGIFLSVLSGFRPAYGPNFSGLTDRNRPISFTTQESLRRNQTRWIAAQRALYATDDDYVFMAPTNAFSPPTVPPGVSIHGSGRALDFNTGGRDNLTPLNTDAYVWLVRNSYRFGFIRTVPTEEWHFEYLPVLAVGGPYAKLAGTDANKFYADLGLGESQIVV